MKLHATGRDLLIKESERLISGSIKIYECEFTFDESWDGYTVTAVFSTNGSRLINMAVVDGKCEIPSEVLRPNARIRVGVFGIDGDRRRPTTYSEWITVEQGVDLGGGSAQPPTPSVYEQWLRGLDEKQDEWNANEEARAEAEAARVEAENARVEAEEAREAQETGYVAQAESWAKEAEDQAKEAKSWADKAQEVVGGDYATKAQAQAMADAAEVDANAYTDQQIAAIPTPDVSGQIETHNTSETSHADIREAFGNFHTKAETLTEDTKALFGLDSDAVPDDVLNVLKDVALYKKVPNRTEKTLGEFAEGDTVYLNESGLMTAYVVAKHNYQADLNGNGRTLLIRKQSLTSTRSYWAQTDVSTYNGSRPDTYLQTEFIAQFDSDVQEAIGTTKFYYTIGAPSRGAAIDNTVAVLERSIFLPSVTELGLSDRVACNVEGERIDVLADNLASFMSSTTSHHWTRTPHTSTTGVCAWYIHSSNNYTYVETLVGANAGCRELPMFTMPEDFVFYVDAKGNIHKEQDCEIVVTRADGSEFEKPLGVKAAYGTYAGTGTYGKNNPNSLTFDFEPKMVVITQGAQSDVEGAYSAYSSTQDAMLLMKYRVISWSSSSNVLGYSVAVKFDGKTVYWYTSQSNAYCQANATNAYYHYVAIG